MSPWGTPSWPCARRGGTPRMLPQPGAPWRSRANLDCVNCRRATLIAVGVEDVQTLCAPRGGKGRRGARMLAQPDAPRRLVERPTNPIERGALCGCSRAACGHPLGCAGVTQPNVAIGESDMALSAPRRDGAHAPAPRSSPEVARALRLHQLPPRHTHRRRGPGRRHVVLPSGGPAHAPAATHTVEVARGR